LNFKTVSFEASSKEGLKIVVREGNRNVANEATGKKMFKDADTGTSTLR
jgi:hypothetical protein